MEAIFKLFTAVRGGTREVLETAIDANAIRILRQEIHEAEAAVAKAKKDLTQVVAEKIRLFREISTMEAALSDRETQVGEALKKGQQDAARHSAVWIADNEPVLLDLRDKHRKLEGYENDLTRSLKTVVRSIDDYRRELRMVQATESSHAASRRIQRSASLLGSQLTGMDETLQRIRRKQEGFIDSMAAREDVERSLGTAVQGPGFPVHLPKVDVEAVLQRIREKNGL